MKQTSKSFVCDQIEHYQELINSCTRIVETTSFGNDNIIYNAEYIIDTCSKIIKYQSMIDLIKKLRDKK